MTDSGRKDLGDKISDKMTPDQSKSTLDRAGETISGMGDKVARDTVPDSQKSTSQSLQDKATREKDHHSNESMGDKIKNVFTGKN